MNRGVILFRDTLYAAGGEISSISEKDIEHLTADRSSRTSMTHTLLVINYNIYSLMVSDSW